MARRPARHPVYGADDDLLDAAVAATIDLHGMAAAVAEAELMRFVPGCQGRHPGKVIHIVTGKGRHSPGKAVLKSLAARLLRGPLGVHLTTFDADVDGGGYLVKLRR